jgi:hypothetical protein
MAADKRGFILPRKGANEFFLRNFAIMICDKSASAKPGPGKNQRNGHPENL